MIGYCSDIDKEVWILLSPEGLLGTTTTSVLSSAFLLHVSTLFFRIASHFHHPTCHLLILQSQIYAP